MNYPSKVLQNAVIEISQLPGIGRRSALRLVLHLLKQPSGQAHALSEAIAQLVDEIQYCQVCKNISETEICEICSNPVRDESLICVVEDVRDVMAIENTHQFKGKFHVLGGLISPMDGIGPEELNIASLIKRLENTKVKEVVFALSSTIEGDTTIFYIYKQAKSYPISFTTIARGIGVGEEIEYTDQQTLVRSLENRVPYQENFV